MHINELFTCENIGTHLAIDELALFQGEQPLSPIKGKGRKVP
jgi:hypothetical protein